MFALILFTFKGVLLKENNLYLHSILNASIIAIVVLRIFFFTNASLRPIMLESGPYLGPEIGQCIFFFSVYICRLDMYISTYEK